VALAWPEIAAYSRQRGVRLPWVYELRGSDNHLVEIRSGFSTEKAARKAALRAKRLVDCICYPNPETLTVVVKEGESMVSRAAEMPPSASESSASGSKKELRYPWQRLVLDAFREPHLEKALLRINVAERAISERLVDPNPFELAERLAIGEALLSLRRLLAQVRAAFTAEEPDSEESIA
jgi:hypothetical protein